MFKGVGIELAGPSMLLAVFVGGVYVVCLCLKVIYTYTLTMVSGSDTLYLKDDRLQLVGFSHQASTISFNGH